MIGQGRVSDDHGKIDCDHRDPDDGVTNCYAEYAGFEAVVLTAESAGGSKFDEWVGCDQEENQTCVVYTNESKTVVAAFEPVEFALISPPDNHEIYIEGNADDEVRFRWEHPVSAADADPDFTWLLAEAAIVDTPDNQFEEPDLVRTADGGGADTTLTMTHLELDDFLQSQGVSEGEKYHATWTVRAEYAADSVYAQEAFDVTLIRGVVTRVEETGTLPEEFTLEQNYPNPFNASTSIRFDIPEDADVILRIYNSVGQEIAIQIEDHKRAGSYEVEFEASDHLPSGMYIYRLEADRLAASGTMMYLK